MFHWMKAGTLLVGSLALVAGTPADSSAGFFPWLYDSMFAPTGYPYGYTPYGYGYYATGYRTAYYAPGFYGSPWAGDCGCQPACNACAPCGGCSPCGAGCPGGNCGVSPAPAGPPVPEPDQVVDPTAPPSRPSRPTFDPDSPDAPVYEPPMPGSRGGAPSRTLPDDDFKERRGTTPERGAPGNEPAGASDGFDANSDPNAVTTPGASRKPNLGEASETVIPARKPAEAAPVDESTPNHNGGPKLEERSTSRPVIEKQRLVLQSNYNAPKLVRDGKAPGTRWSGVDTHIVRH